MATDIATLDMTENQLSDDVLYEVVNGQIVELPPMGIEQELTAGELYAHLWTFAAGKNVGRPAIEALFDFTEQLGKKLRPDVAFVSYDRWPKAKARPKGDSWKVVPNLTVEVVSPSNVWEGIHEKIKEYFQVGVQRVWLVSPAHCQVHVYDSPTTVRILTEKDDLTDDEMLPGFRLALRELFEVRQV